MTRPQMTMDEAREVLKDFIPKSSAGLDYNRDDYLLWAPHSMVATLDGEFTADQLEAIAVYMRDNSDPTRE